MPKTLAEKRAWKQAEWIIANTKCEETFSVSLKTHEDRLTIEYLINGSVDWDIGFRIMQFHANNVQLERY